MIWILNSLILLLFSALLCSCGTLQQKAASIQASETALFEGRATVGYIPAFGNSISWDQNPTRPILVTATTFYYGNSALPYSAIQQVEVRSMILQKSPFGKEIEYKDLLIVRGRNDGEKGGTAFIFVPADQKKGDPAGSPAQRELAEKASRAIDQQRIQVDLFGRVDGPRRVGFVVNRGRVWAMWWRTPRYLDYRFPEQRKAIDALFKMIEKPATDSFCKGIGNHMLPKQPSYGFYSFDDIGELDNRSSSYNKIWSTSRIRVPELSSLVKMDTIRIYLRERISPQGIPSVQAEFSCSVEFHDVEIGRLASSKAFSHSVTLPLQTWIEGGEARILAEIDESMQVIAAKVEAALNE